MENCNCSQEKRLTRIEGNQLDTDQKVDTMGQDIVQIRGALLGDEFHPKNGLVNQVTEQDEKIDEILKLINSAKYWIIGAGAVFTGIIVILTILSYVK